MKNINNKVQEDIFTKEKAKIGCSLQSDIWEEILKLEENQSNKTFVENSIKELNRVFKSIENAQNGTDYSTLVQRVQKIGNKLADNKKLNIPMSFWENYNANEINPYYPLYRVFKKTNMEYMVVPHFLLYTEEDMKILCRPPVETLTKQAFEEKMKSLILGGITQIIGCIVQHYTAVYNAKVLKKLIEEN